MRKSGSEIGALRRFAMLASVLTAATFPLQIYAPQASAKTTSNLSELRAAHFGHWKKLAKRGDPEAQLNLGFLYATGRGVARDQEEALRWYQSSAEGGNALALETLSIIDASLADAIRRELASRDRVAKSAGTSSALSDARAEDFDELKSLAEGGDAIAQAKLAYLYVSGRGAVRNIEAGTYWYQIAGEAGNIAARRAIAFIRDAQDGGRWRRDLVKAIQLDLASVGLEPGAPDGILGKRTRSAIREAEERLGLEVTGQPSDELLTAMAMHPEELYPSQVVEETEFTAASAPVPSQTGTNASSSLPAWAPPPLPKSKTRPAQSIDSSAPIIDAPASVQALDGYVTFSGTVADRSQIAEFRSDGVPIRLEAGRFTVRQRVSPSSDRLHLTAADQFGNESLHVVKFEHVKAGVPNVEKFGRFHALVIGNNAYANLPLLTTAVKDAEVVANLLKRDYGYEVTILLNATRTDIRRALSQLRNELTDEDNLLVYYAGHGWNDTRAKEAYWLPVDADENDDTNWISNSTISTSLRGMQAKHVLVVADSCFSGTLTRGLSLTGMDASFEVLGQQRSRTALTSGGNEPVLDKGGEGHSVFALEFIKALEQNTAILDTTTLFSEIRRPVMLNARQTPQYGDIRLAGHEGGDYLFVRNDR